MGAVKTVQDETIVMVEHQNGSVMISRMSQHTAFLILCLNSDLRDSRDVIKYASDLTGTGPIR